MQPTNQRSDSSSDLEPTTTAILRECPRFRILVLGKSGVGKSTLINKAFGVQLAAEASFEAGKSDINAEITSESNERFVLHDSQGFEADESDNFERVRNFIKQRGKMTKLEDKLHAIWLCLETPSAGGRVFEKGDEDFLKLDLGGVPVIVVFTKFDLLQRAIEKTIEEEYVADLTDDELEVHVKKLADDEFKQICVDRLKDIKHPYVKVSTSYKDTLENLVETTQQHVSETVTIMWAIAQRASAELSIQASIKVGKKKYWRGLASSMNFPGKTLKKCLDTIHVDIIKVWNFNDPEMYLTSDEFKAHIYKGIGDLGDPDLPNTAHHTSAGIVGLAGITGVVSAVAPPAAVVVIPIAAGVLLAKWAYDIYQQTPSVLQRLMGYIVDLTHVMQCLFWIMREKGEAQALTETLLDQAVDDYYNPSHRTHIKIHQEIKTFVRERNVFQHFAGSDLALTKVVELLEANTTQSPGVRKYANMPSPPEPGNSTTPPVIQSPAPPAQAADLGQGSSSPSRHSDNAGPPPANQAKKGTKGKGIGKKFKGLFSR